MFIFALIVFIIIFGLIGFISYLIYKAQAKTSPVFSVDATAYTEQILPDSGFSSPIPVPGVTYAVPSNCNIYGFIDSVQPTYNLLGTYTPPGAQSPPNTLGTYNPPPGVIIGPTISCLELNKARRLYVFSYRTNTVA